jgi:hypothetical protein
VPTGASSVGDLSPRGEAGRTLVTKGKTSEIILLTYGLVDHWWTGCHLVVVLRRPLDLDLISPYRDTITLTCLDWGEM